MADSSIAVSVTRTDRGQPLLDLVTKTADVGALIAPSITVAANTPSTATQLWLSDQHGVSGTRTAPFSRLIIAVDPEHTLTRDDDDPQFVYIKLYRTPQAGGSATAFTEIVPVEIGHALILSTPVCGTAVPGTSYVTKAEAFNPSTTEAVPVVVVQQ